MNVFFFFVTAVTGFLIEILFNHYLTLFGVSPNMLLLMVIAFGFILGPLQGAVLGFIWGLFSDAMGIHVFGLNAFLLTLFGYLAGTLKRRFDAERPAPQVVIACVATLLNSLLAFFIFGFIEEAEHRVSLAHLAVEIFMNGLLAAGVFWVTDQWIDLWRLEQDHL